jgi:hypothetical protein
VTKATGLGRSVIAGNVPMKIPWPPC